jgi:hypothetical protein
MSNRKDITELKGGLNKKPIFIAGKMKVDSKEELEDDFEMFELYWKREITKRLEDLGEIKFLTMIT